MSAASLRAGFPNLKVASFGKALVAYEPSVTTVVNVRRADLPRSHRLFYDDGLEADDVVLLETVLFASERYYVIFSEGPSADPAFCLIRVGAPSDTCSSALAGNALAIPANGSIYIASRFNNYFTKRTKFVYSADGLREMRQPYFFVGLKTHTLKAITLYDSPKGDTAVAQLPSGAEIEVLLTDDSQDSESRTCFLVKTPFGLLGWVWVPSSQYKSDVIEGISWWGD